jgi:peptidoglycan L-alanyl-D-glutamate endopeptidase CwlK
MTDRDLQRLTGVHPALIDAIREVFDEMAAWGTPMFVVMGVRTQAQQVALYAQGRTAPGHIVTDKDGVVHKSDHQPHADGYGYAVDCAFTDGDPFADSHPWQVYGDACEKRGLIWGGRWTTLVDRPHAQLPDVSQGAKIA